MLQLVSKETPDVKRQREVQISQKRFQLAKLLRCTEAMLISAQNGDWKSVEEMDDSRKVELVACFSNCSHEDPPLFAEALATLIHLNEQITILVSQAKNEMLSAQQDLQNGKNAAHKYQHYQENLETL